MSSVLVAHPTGNANVRNVLRALEESGHLREYHTTLAVFESSWTGKVSRLPGGGELRRRQYDQSLRNITVTHPWREALRLFSQRLGLAGFYSGERAWASVDRVCQALDLQTAAAVRRLSPQVAYCYEDVARETFREAKRRGAACLYDLPIGYWRAGRRILAEEAERRPDWGASMAGLRDSEAKLERKDEELRLADRILVASTFTKETLCECPFQLPAIEVIPYGADEAFAPTPENERDSRTKSLKVLFVGGLSQRKGIADLFEGVDRLGSSVELTVIGRKPAEVCVPLEAALRKHRWIESLPHTKILEEMRRHDVLVFPSLFEGFGLVVTEALSQGLPVITTPNTCGPDVITEGSDGFVVPIRDPQAIAEKLELLHRDRERLAAMRQAALDKAKMLTWESYRNGVLSVVREVLAVKSA